MDAVGTTIILKKNRNATESTTSASRGLAYLNRLIKLATFDTVKTQIAKARNAEKSYITYLQIGVMIATVIIVQNILTGFMQSPQPIAELTMCLASPGISNIPTNLQGTTFGMMNFGLI